MNLISIIANNNYGLYNKEIAKKIGLQEAVLLGELASEFDYYYKNKMLEDNWFFSTIENIEEQTTLNDYQQRKALNKLKEYNIVEIKVKGIPAKRYIKINEEQVFKIFDIEFLNNSKTSSLNFKELYNNNNTNSNNNNINNMNIIYNWEKNVSCECLTNKNRLCDRRSTYKINGKNYCNQHSKQIISKLLSKEEQKQKTKQFQKPTLEEIKQYCLERNNNVDAKRFFDYYEVNDWKDQSGKPVKNWKQKMIANWEKKERVKKEVEIEYLRI